MKSRINHLVDYRTVPFERTVTVECTPDYMEGQLRHLTRNFKKTQAVKTLEKGDVAVLSLQSTAEKFNRSSVYVTVGGGLFDTELESQLAGHAVGETFTATSAGTPVTVTVKSAMRTTFPEPTDEMVAAYAAEHEEFAGVNTVAAYKEKVRADRLTELRTSAMYDRLQAVMDYVLTHSDFDFDEEEVAERKAAYYEEVKAMLAESGKTLEELTADEMLQNFGISTPEDLEREITKQVEWSIAEDLWLVSLFGKTGEEMETYPWKFLDDYIRGEMKYIEK